MIDRSTDIRAALRSRQRGFLINPFRFGGGPAGDPHYANVSLLLHMDGTNGSTTFTDSSPSPKTVTANGNAQISTAQSKFSGASGLFDGAADYLSTSATADFGFGSGDLVTEAWIYPTALSGSDKAITDFRTGTTAPLTSGCVMFLDSTASFRIAFWDNTTKYGAAGSTPTVNAWSHIAVTRSGNTLRAFLNGVQQWSATHTKDLGSSNIVGVGACAATGGSIQGTSAFLGYIDDVRVTKGVARYTANFTLPAAAFPNF